MSLIDEERKVEQDGTNRALFIVVGVVSVVVIGALAIWFIRIGGGKTPDYAKMINPSQKLEGPGVIREGTPEFDQYKGKISMDERPEAVESERVIGDIVMRLEATVRNFSGKTLTGLEVYGAVVDLNNKPVKERTVIVIPTQREYLDNNRNMKVHINFEGFKISDDRANIKMRITAFRFEE
jgi:hypothetical protein